MKQQAPTILWIIVPLAGLLGSALSPILIDAVVPSARVDSTMVMVPDPLAAGNLFDEFQPRPGGKASAALMGCLQTEPCRSKMIAVFDSAAMPQHPLIELPY